MLCHLARANPTRCPPTSKWVQNTLMKLSPRMKASPSWGGRSSPMMPTTHSVCWPAVTFRMQSSGRRSKLSLPNLKVSLGRDGTELQSTFFSLPGPKALVMASTTAVGPAMTEVPVSIMALSPPLLQLVPLKTTSLMLISQQVSEMRLQYLKLSVAQLVLTPPRTSAEPAMPGSLVRQKLKELPSTFFCSTSRSKIRGRSSTEILRQAMPRMPSNFAAMKESPTRRVTCPKRQPVAVTSATLQTSWPTQPETAPEPQVMLKLVPLYLQVEDLVESKYLWRQQAALRWHSLLGTQRLELPVSKMTSKGWPGVPMVMGPQYWVSRQLLILTSGQEYALTCTPRLWASGVESTSYLPCRYHRSRIVSRRLRSLCTIGISWIASAPASRLTIMIDYQLNNPLALLKYHFNPMPLSYLTLSRLAANQSTAAVTIAAPQCFMEQRHKLLRGLLYQTRPKKSSSCRLSGWPSCYYCTSYPSSSMKPWFIRQACGSATSYSSMTLHPGSAWLAQQQALQASFLWDQQKKCSTRSLWVWQQGRPDSLSIFLFSSLSFCEQSKSLMSSVEAAILSSGLARLCLSTSLVKIVWLTGRIQTPSRLRTSLRQKGHLTLPRRKKVSRQAEQQVCPQWIKIRGILSPRSQDWRQSLQRSKSTSWLTSYWILSRQRGWGESACSKKWAVGFFNFIDNGRDGHGLCQSAAGATYMDMEKQNYDKTCIQAVQIAGHNAVLSFHHESVYKKAGPSELQFYSRALTSPCYLPFLCNVKAVREDGIVLENVLFGLSAPSVIDLKPGLHRTELHFEEEKNQRMRRKEELTGCAQNGFRISGFLLRDQHLQISEHVKVKTDEQRRRLADPHNLKSLFARFFSINSEVHLPWVLQTIDFLKRFETFLREENEYRFRGTSLLMVSDQRSGRLRIKWIDFSYSWHEGRGFVEENLVAGTEMFRQFLSANLL